MLPIPFRNYIPRILKQDFDTDEGGQALATKIDTHLLEWLDEIRDLKNLRNPVKCPAIILDILGYQLNAGIKNYDSERTKRKKIITSISNLKNRGLWNYDLKNRIDTITGTDSELVRVIDSGVWLQMCHELEDPDRYWGTISDTTDSELGLIIEDTTLNILTAGIIRINTKLPNTPESLLLIDKIKIEIQDEFTPAYMQLWFGYVDNGSFIIFSNGVL